MPRAGGIFQVREGGRGTFPARELRSGIALGKVHGLIGRSGSTPITIRLERIFEPGKEATELTYIYPAMSTSDDPTKFPVLDCRFFHQALLIMLGLVLSAFALSLGAAAQKTQSLYGRCKSSWSGHLPQIKFALVGLH
jgi:hypothetical protein